MTFFALVHGGAHGGWCWERLIPELEDLGHQCSAPDLPFDDPNGASEWADAVLATIPVDADRVVVVGHSLAGLCLPVIASRRRVDRLVYLAAVVPAPGRSFLDVLADEPEAIKVPAARTAVTERTAMTVDADAVMSYADARAMFYGDVDEQTAVSAWQRLRPQGMAAFTEKCPVDEWPDVPTTYVLMTDDAAVDQEWSRRVATDRLGAEIIEFPGSHSPFYSRPRELAELLDQIDQRR